MKIAYPHLETPLILEENSPLVLFIENPREYFNVVNQIIYSFKKEESDFSYWDGNEQISPDKTGEILTDLFSFELNDKKILSLLYKKLQQIFQEGDLFVKFQEVSAKIENFLSELCLETNFALDYEPASFELLLKVCSVKAVENYESLLEKIICYINLFVQLKNIKFFIFVGLKNFLCDEDLNMLYRHCRQNKISVFLIESAKVRPLIYEERAIIITEDLCEIVENFPQN